MSIEQKKDEKVAQKDLHHILSPKHFCVPLVNFSQAVLDHRLFVVVGAFGRGVVQARGFLFQLVGFVVDLPKTVEWGRERARKKREINRKYTQMCVCGCGRRREKKATTQSQRTLKRRHSLDEQWST